MQELLELFCGRPLDGPSVEGHRFLREADGAPLAALSRGFSLLRLHRPSIWRTVVDRRKPHLPAPRRNGFPQDLAALLGIQGLCRLAPVSHATALATARPVRCSCRQRPRRVRLPCGHRVCGVCHPIGTEDSFCVLCLKLADEGLDNLQDNSDPRSTLHSQEPCSVPALLARLDLGGGSSGGSADDGRGKSSRDSAFPAGGLGQISRSPAHLRPSAPRQTYPSTRVAKAADSNTRSKRWKRLQKMPPKRRKLEAIPSCTSTEKDASDREAPELMNFPKWQYPKFAPLRPGAVDEGLEWRKRLDAREAEKW